ncbi:hypothetical protein COLO4_13856 [Corchorus olitorius]|uniref:Uncharacterized protein n=1 Tax=Corchorus olitorius TaxID=93759 RepID=A0A1R3JUM3_9ROSI|nr:hypothetical protein COLO4_13856 [Corchorus olitorius]
MEPSIESSPPIAPALSTLPLPPPPTEAFNTDLTDFRISLHALYGHASQSI